MREFMCSSHTISGVMPGSAVASRFPLERRLAACSEAGFSGLWLHWRDFLENRERGLDAADIGSLFDSAGMKHRAIEFLTGWFLGDGQARAQEAAALDAAAAIGADLVSVGGDFSGQGIPEGQMVERFHALCACAAAHRIRVGLEIVPWSNVATVDAALAHVAPANAGIVIDTWHVFRGGIPLSDLARIPPDKVFCVQVNDAAAPSGASLAEETMRRLPCGEGTLDLAGFAAIMDSCGWAPPVSVEIIAPEMAALPPERSALLAIAGARRLFGHGFR